MTELNTIGDNDLRDRKSIESPVSSTTLQTIARPSKKFLVESVTDSDTSCFHSGSSLDKKNNNSIGADEEDSSINDLPLSSLGLSTVTSPSGNGQLIESRIDDNKSNGLSDQTSMPSQSAGTGIDSSSEGSTLPESDEAKPKEIKKHLLAPYDLNLIESDSADSVDLEALSSAYVQNLSINRLLAERHKPSMAAVGRVLGRKRQNDSDTASTVSSEMSAAKSRTKRCHVNSKHVGLVCMVILIIVAAVTTSCIYTPSVTKLKAEKGFIFDQVSRELLVYRYGETDVPVLTAYLGRNLENQLPFNCTEDIAMNDERCYRWPKLATLRIKVMDDPMIDGRCFEISWISLRPEPRFNDCLSINVNKNYWYGGTLGVGNWPLGQSEIPYASFLPGNEFGNMAERLWISSGGNAIVANYEFPLHIQVTASRLCLSSWYGYHEGVRYLNYSICEANSTKSVHQLVMRKYYKDNPPPLDVDDVQYTLFNSDGQIEKMRSRLANLSVNGFIHVSQQNAIDKTIDIPSNSLNMTDLGIRISPYVSLSNPIFMNDTQNSLWMKSPGSKAPALYVLGNNTYAMLNASHPQFKDFINNRLGLKNVLLEATDGFSSLITGQQYYDLHEHNGTFQPYLDKYLCAVAGLTNKAIMSPLAGGTQATGAIFKLPPITDLKQTVANIILSSVMGYQLLNPGELGTPNMSPEMFIRSIQLAAFLPVMQFSENAWNYDANTTKLWSKWMAARSFEIFPLVKDRIVNHRSGPLYAPIWWNNPSVARKEEFYITDQFLFGKLMIAPIVDSSKHHRLVYFPKGYWLRKYVDNVQNNGLKNIGEIHSFVGPSLRNFTVSLNDILVFEYASDDQTND